MPLRCTAATDLVTRAPTITLTSPATEPEWHEAGILIDELIDWDFERFRAQCYERADLVRAFYPDNLEDVRRHCSGADGRFLLARGDGDAAGCASFRRLDDHTCELYNVYVRHGYRGHGIGALLLRQLQGDARRAGYQAMYLETATYMLDAHRLYHSLGFEVRGHYRAIPEQFAALTLSMQCDLRDADAHATDAS
jgi:ribosomal protein S18 acetylase RimI-like enzyme